MLVDQAVRKLLATDAGVIAIASTRIYGGILSQDATQPSVTYRVVSRDHEEDLDGPSGLRTSRFRIYSTARKKVGDYTVAKQLDEAVRLALHGFSGTVTDLTVSPPETIEIQRVFAASSFDFYDDKTETHQIISDYLVTAHEVIP